MESRNIPHSLKKNSNNYDVGWSHLIWKKDPSSYCALHDPTTSATSLNIWRKKIQVFSFSLTIRLSRLEMRKMTVYLSCSIFGHHYSFIHCSYSKFKFVITFIIHWSSSSSLSFSLIHLAIHISFKFVG